MTQRNVSSARRRAFDRQGGFCLWCGAAMLWFREVRNQNHPRLCTAEHLIPKKHGGKNNRKNIAASCFQCNTARKDHPLEIWLPRVKFRLRQSGNPQHYDAILSFLKEHGIEPSVGPTLLKAPDIIPRPSAP